MHSIPRRIRATALAGVSAVALALPAVVPVVAASARSGDPGVARISDVAGPVDVHRADASAAYAVARNAPVSVGDDVETQKGARAEVEFDHATVLRVAPATQVRFTHLTPADHELQVAQGTVELRLFRGADGHPLVETPNADVRPGDTGRYRVSVDASGNTIVKVRSGRVDVVALGGRGSRSLGAGASIEIAGSGRDARFRDRGELAYDSFDGYCDGRDDGWSRVSNWSYVDEGMVGENDLSDYGQWVDDSQYGQVWQPTDVAADWSPYSDGQWVWASDSYGWTWVGNEPWGYAPYHYGRWYRGPRNRWSWTPGAYGEGRTYAYEPAVVGFFGLGSGIGLSFAIGDIGWVALAPGEAYAPWWNGRYDGYGDRRGNDGFAVNDPGRYYRNARYAGAAVAVTGRDFANGRFTHVRHLGKNDLAHAVAYRGVLPVVPTSRNLAFGRAGVARNAPAVSRRFARMAHPSVTAVAFAKQRTTVATLARKQYPTYAASIVRQTKAGRGAGFTRATVIGHTVTRPAPATVWSRFGKSPARAAYVAPKSRIVTDGTHSFVAPHAVAHTYVAPHAATHTYVAPHAATHTYVAPHAAAHTYVAPVHTYVAPAHTYAAPVHTYVAPVTHTYVAPHPAVVQQRTITPPVRVAPPHVPAAAQPAPGVRHPPGK
jgi:hypothetical protein